jgi:ADP-dependent NAD(P)H-hydrate dehydratase / NAD(P)H-hydrate epimerase
VKISRVDQMRALDRRASDTFGISELVLMENAGVAAYLVLQQVVGVPGRSFAVVCGIGNNGGDGLVVARQLHAGGGAVTVLILGDPARYADAARTNYDIVTRLPIEVIRVDDVSALRGVVMRSDTVVDAIFGTGIARDVAGLFRAAIESINDVGRGVLSLDIPSGVSGDTGQVLGVAIRADHTVTFGLPKVGNVLPPGSDHGGRLYVSHISFPPSMYDADDLTIAVNEPLPLPRRTRRGRTRGAANVLFVAGSSEATGDVCVAATAFMRAGGGRAQLVGPRSMAEEIARRAPDVSWLFQDEGPVGGSAIDSVVTLLEVARTSNVVVGAGLGDTLEGRRLVRALLAGVERPLVSNGVNVVLLDDGPPLVATRGRAVCWVLDPAQVAGVLRADPSEADVDRVTTAQRAAERLAATVVLPGRRALVACPDGRVFINVARDRGALVDGHGAILAGAIAAMAVEGLALPDAARQGAFVSGVAMDLVAEGRAGQQATTEDVLTQLRPAARMLRAGIPRARRERYLGVTLVEAGCRRNAP